MVFEQHEIEDAVLDHFATIFQGTRVAVRVARMEVDQVELALRDIDQILASDLPRVEDNKFEDQICQPFSYVELEQALQELPNNKAAGVDNISNEMIKNSGQSFRLYLQTFLNKIIEDGEVPPDLNIGKCVLVHKVDLHLWLKHVSLDLV